VTVVVELRHLDGTVSPAALKVVPRKGEQVSHRKNHEMGQFVVTLVEHLIDLPHDPKIVVHLVNA